MDFHARRAGPQNPIKAGQLAEAHRVVAVVVIEFFERGERLVARMRSINGRKRTRRSS